MLAMDAWNFIAERKIREAMEEGGFDQLEGMGEPRDLREDPFEDSSLRMAHRLLKNNGFAPAWIPHGSKPLRYARAGGSGLRLQRAYPTRRRNTLTDAD